MICTTYFVRLIKHYSDSFNMLAKCSELQVTIEWFDSFNFFLKCFNDSISFKWKRLNFIEHSYSIWVITSLKRINDATVDGLFSEHLKWYYLLYTVMTTWNFKTYLYIDGASSDAVRILYTSSHPIWVPTKDKGIGNCIIIMLLLWVNVQWN